MNTTTVAAHSRTADYLTAAQKSLATSEQRGQTLLTEGGYTIEPYPQRPGVYSVMRGDADTRPLRTGETLWNDVDTCNQDCTCEGYRWHGTCKHLIATNKAVAAAARLMAPMLPPPPCAVIATNAIQPKLSGVMNTPEWKKRVAADFD